MKVLQWLKLQEEIDYWLFILNKMLIDERKLTTIDKMIDNATGYDKEKLKRAKQIIKKVDKLKEKYHSLSR